ncbi:hypothetical protein [Nonomuraea recticatena]|uniref:Uncharacterized protein n=1 Tax=Nonomuraea recticatena TaxID=46178 RepID=A0ABN3RIV7_9ACTN
MTERYRRTVAHHGFTKILPGPRTSTSRYGRIWLNRSARVPVSGTVTESTASGWLRVEPDDCRFRVPWEHQTQIFHPAEVYLF